MTIAQISLQADIELEAVVSAALIDEFNRQESGAMNLRVGVDIQFFPNLYNIIILRDVTGKRPPLITQCKGFYTPELEGKAAGETPVVRLDLNITELPDDVLGQLTAADPRVIETGDLQGVQIITVRDGSNVEITRHV